MPTRTAEGWVVETRSPPTGDGRSVARNGHDRAGGMIVERSRPKSLGQGRAATPELKALGSGWDGGGSFTEILQSQLQLSGAEELTRPYSEVVWVKLCLKVFGMAALQAPPRIYRGDPLVDESASDAIDDHPVAKLLASPNDHQSASTFRYADLVHYKLDGETVWFLMDAAGKPVVPGGGARDKTPLPVSIVPVRGDAVEIQYNDRGLPGAYIYPSRSRMKFPAASVVHFRDYDPDRPLRGVGDVETLLRDLAQDFAAQRYQEGLLANGGQPGGWVISQTPVTAERRKQEDAKLRDRTGSTSNAGAWHFLDGKDISVVPNTMRPRDLEYSKLRQWVRDLCAPVLGVPLPLLGIAEHLTFDNLRQAKRMLWTGGNGVISYLRAVEDTINTFFLPRLREGQGMFLRHDLSLVAELQEELSAKLETAAKIAVSRVGISFNVAAAKLGIDEDLPPEGDTVLFPIGLTTLEGLGGAPIAGESDGDGGGERAVEGTVELAAEQCAEPRAESRAERDPESVLEARRIRAAGEKRMKAAMRKYLRAVELAQIKRLEAFAERGADALKSGVASVVRIPEGVTFIATLTEADIADLLVDPEEWAEKLSSAARPPIRASFIQSAKAIAERNGASPLSGVDPRVVAQLEKQVKRLTFDANGTIWRRVRRGLVDVFRTETTGANVTTVQAAVRELLPKLNSKLKLVFGDRDARALAIARTEVGRATSKARFMQAGEMGVTHTRWITSGQENVRDAHAALNGEVRPLGDEFAPGLKHPHDEDAPAEQVVNCFPGGTLVAGTFDLAMRSEYVGPLIEVVAGSGARLSVTPNHPVLTPRGFVPAASLREGDYLIRHEAGGERAGPVDHHDHRPLVAEELFHSFLRRGAFSSIELSRLDLHGDARFTDRKIDVAVLNRELLADDESASAKDEGECVLVGAAMGAARETRRGGGEKFRSTAHAAGARAPRRRASPLDLRSIALDRRPLQSRSFGLIPDLPSVVTEDAFNRAATYSKLARHRQYARARVVSSKKRRDVHSMIYSTIGSLSDRDSMLDQDALHGDARDSGFFSKLREAHAGFVTVDVVVRVRKLDSFVGHVYDFRSPDGWIIAQGLVVSNCNCDAEEIFQGAEP